jgi:membrane associated rhomboid family serine protease
MHYSLCEGSGRTFHFKVASGRESAFAIQKEDWKSPIYTLIGVQALLFLLSQGGHWIFSKTDICLSIRNPQWWQILSSGFAFINHHHFSEVIFITYVFGRVIERRHGLIGLWLSYLGAVLGK